MTFSAVQGVRLSLAVAWQAKGELLSDLETKSKSGNLLLFAKLSLLSQARRKIYRQWAFVPTNFYRKLAYLDTGLLKTMESKGPSIHLGKDMDGHKVCIEMVLPLTLEVTGPIFKTVPSGVFQKRAKPRDFLFCP